MANTQVAESSRLLFQVEDTFALPWGLTLAPGLKHTDVPALRGGEPIELRRPDGLRIRSRIEFIQMGYFAHLPGRPIALPANLTKEDVPIGTEVWLLTKAAP